MSIFLLVSKDNKSGTNGVRLEKGMNVEINMPSSSLSSFMSTQQGQKSVQEAFMGKYNIDLKKGGFLSHVHFDVNKM